MQGKGTFKQPAPVSRGGSASPRPSQANPLARFHAFMNNFYHVVQSGMHCRDVVLICIDRCDAISTPIWGMITWFWMVQYQRRAHEVTCLHVPMPNCGHAWLRAYVRTAWKKRAIARHASFMHVL